MWTPFFTSPVSSTTSIEDQEVAPHAGDAGSLRGGAQLHRIRQRATKRAAGKYWREHGLVFASTVDTELDAHNVRREFRKVIKAVGLRPDDWTPREMRHSFVSLLSDAKVPIEDISRLCGHSGTAVTAEVYRHQIRPVMVEAATAMNDLFEA